MAEHPRRKSPTRKADVFAAQKYQLEAPLNTITSTSLKKTMNFFFALDLRNKGRCSAFGKRSVAARSTVRNRPSANQAFHPSEVDKSVHTRLGG
ncbi:hypothetical protein RB195_019741 [Necator americanus]|uniref:Uncharacterized protein n=1 Tax=Necator americanus TaxID=51031 RepID=A0ABR1CHJ1_NECAM